MNLLFPLYLLGALAVAVPIILHLTGRPPKDRTPFSSLMFLKKTETPLKQRRKVEDPLLMLLRCLVLGLLAFIFTRPFFNVAAKPSATDPEELLAVLIDSSASMKREGLWEQAIAKAQKILDEVTENDRVALYHFNRELHRLIPFETWGKLPPEQRVAESRKALEQLKPSWYETDLGKALVGVAEAMEDDDVEQRAGFRQRRLVLIGDLQEGSHLEALQTYEWPNEIQLQIEALESESTINAGLHAVLEQQVTSDEKQAVRVRVRNAAGSSRSDFNLQWKNDEIENRMRQVTVEPGQSQSVFFPGARLDQKGQCLVLTGDDEVFDNELFLTPPISYPLHVVYMGPDSISDPENSLYYLSRALQPAGALEPVITVFDETTDNFAEEDFIVATTDLNEERIQHLKAHLEAGKDALFVMQEAGQTTTLEKLISHSGFTAEERVASDYSMLEDVDFEHRLLHPFQGMVFGDFTKIRFWKHRKLDLADYKSAHIFARFDNGDPAWIDFSVGKGSLYVMTSGWHPADSQFALSTKFLPLLFSMAEKSGGDRVYRNQFKVGDIIDFPEESEEVSEIKITKPSGDVVLLSRTERSFVQTDEPGIYTVDLPNRRWRFAVNLDSAESRVEPLAGDALKHLKKLTVYGPSTTPDQETDSAFAKVENESKQKLWKRLMIILLVVVAVETILAGRRKKQQPIEAPA